MRNLIIFYLAQILFINNIFINNSYAQLGNDFRVNDDFTSYNNLESRISVDKFGNFVVVWEDQRYNGLYNIYAQAFTQQAQPIGTNFIINTLFDTVSSPDISFSLNGRFGIVWRHYSINSNIVLKIYNNNLTPFTSPIRLNDTNISTNIYSNVRITAIKNNFIAVWQQFQGSPVYPDIYFQRVDLLGNKIGINQKVNDDTGSYRNEHPDITVLPDGRFIITWEDSRPPSVGASDIFMQIYDSAGNKIGANQKVNFDMYPQSVQSFPQIASDSSGRFCICFTDFNFDMNDNLTRGAESNVKCQLYNSDGSRNGNNFYVANSFEDEALRTIGMKENGDFVVGFIESTLSEYTSYFQRVKSTGELMGDRFLLSTEAPLVTKNYNDLVVYKDRIISTWADNRNSNPDIYCNVRSFSNPDSIVGIEQISIGTPVGYKLHQNYPNPFNPQTNIKFEIPNNEFITISIYDVMGKEVVILLNQKMNSGIYTTNFNGSTLTNGIYFYKMETERFKQTKKMLLIK